jgi:predicted nucleic acid-binding protein
VVDASVVLEFIVPGRWAGGADRFLGGLAWPTPLALFAPDLVHLEVGNALRKLVIRGNVSDRTAGRLIRSVPELAIVTVESAVLLESAWKLRRQMTIYDASYAALARLLGRPLVTTDRRLVAACTTSGIRAHGVEDPELSHMLDVLEAAGP